MRQLYIFVCILFVSMGIHAQTGHAPHIIKVINETGGFLNSSPDAFTEMDGSLYFTASNSLNGKELWKSDGTEAGTMMVKDIFTGYNSSNIESMINANGTLFFAAYTEDTGKELWKSDGTEAGTVLVKDINPGSNSSNIQRLTHVNGTLYFVAQDSNYDTELWKSDGTEAGTVRVKDINPTGNSVDGYYNTIMEVVNNTLFFTAHDGNYNYNLWKTDGTEVGTVLVKEINPNSSPYIREMVNVNNTLFFIADNGTDGAELWKSDGTETGTVMVKDIYTGPSWSEPKQLTAFNNQLFFTASDATNARELWKSDGTETGTVRVKDINPGNYSSNPNHLVNANGILFFIADDGTDGAELWKSDGTEAGTVRVKDINPTGNSTDDSYSIFLAVGNILYFTAHDGSYKLNIWKSDGTETGTIMVKEFNPGGSSYVPQIMDVNGTLFLSAMNDQIGQELWKSDGTTAGTHIVKDIFKGYSPSVFNHDVQAYIGNTLFFLADDGIHGKELWKSDGTAAGTAMIKDINPGIMSSSIDELINAEGTLYFTARDGTHGEELWKSDGTTVGTVMVKDINPGMNGSSIEKLTNVDGTIFFSNFDSSTGRELWKSDGTEAGTVLVKDIYNVTTPYVRSSNPNWLTNVGGQLYFIADNGTDGKELWKSNGTETGTILVKDINPGTSGSNPSNLVNFNGTLYFSAYDPTYSFEMWQSDGTETGTTIVHDINPSGGSSPTQFMEVNGVLFFVAYEPTTDRELWKFDGTTASLVKDINPGNSSIGNLKNMNGTLYFKANDGVHSDELWKSDGTNAGTVMIKDIHSTYGSGIDDFEVVGNTIFFSASDTNYGRELWKSDGTEAGTTIVQDIDTNGSSNPKKLINVNGRLFFYARTTHNELQYNTSLFTLGQCTPNNTLAVDMVNESRRNSLSFNDQVQSGNNNQTCRCDIMGHLIETTEAEGNNPLTGGVKTQLWVDDTQDPLFVKRHFEITPATNPGTATAKVTLYFTQEDFDDFNAVNTTQLPTEPGDVAGIANLLIEKRPGQSSDGSGHHSTYPDGVNIDPIDSDIVWNATANRWEVSLSVTGFSGFWVKTSSTPLPVELSYFEVEKQGKTAVLTWETASEENNMGFHIQRSSNGFEFETIGWVDGAGSTLDIQEYRFVDEEPMMGINYYRLIQEDWDGTTSPSDVRKVVFEGETSANLFPNPIKGGLDMTLQLDIQDNDDVEIAIVDTNGRFMSHVQTNVEKGMNYLRIPTDRLISGFYFLRISNEKEIQNIKFSVLK